ncbi:MAG: tRNA (adenosine(37)-N6)-threonylcarbamoyltransferase complex transferase subunit TsaD [Phycisphaerales bacterium]|nr:tRNA (adenosine(37)-N6)-threonylcarbamoyltransferase complex transferase subunit TsaD [Phycisphaerales bacterium]
MLILGVESSCDETASAVVRDGREVLSNVIASQHDLHAEYGGVVPEIASRAHVERIVPVVRRALREAGVTPGDLGAVAVGHRPGLIGALLVGVSAAKALAWSLGVPLVGVDHVEAHLYSGVMAAEGQAGAAYPALGLVVSGGHTSLYECRSPIDVRRLGGTIDDAVGEAYDKAAAILGLGHPGGPTVDRLAASGDDRAFDFPISRLGPDSLDFSFSGLKTAVLYAVRGVPVSGERHGGKAEFARDASALTDKQRADVCASFQRAAVAAVVLKLERALARPAPGGGRWKTLLVGGGVSANSRLRKELLALGGRRGVDVRLPPMGLCLDNAAMIAGLAFHRLAAGLADGLSLTASPFSAAAAP